MAPGLRENTIQSAQKTLAIETSGLKELQNAMSGELGGNFEQAVQLIRSARGRAIVTGMGKSGHIGRKISATLASTGTPAFFVHPSEASHGDLGMITPADVVIALSWSGETAELGGLINYTRLARVPVIAITSRIDSTLAKAAEISLVMPTVKEACPHGLAPTTSTVIQLAVGDCLAVALLQIRQFTASDFKVYHPGGSLGASLLFVGDVMHKGNALPLTGTDTPMSEALVTMTEKSLGCLGAVDNEGKLVGIITDGDLRRHMGEDIIHSRVCDIMTHHPRTTAADVLASTALETLNSSGITALFAVNDDGVPVGIVHIHDLLRVGIA